MCAIHFLCIPSQCFVYRQYFYFSLANKCVIISHYGFNLHLTNGKWGWTYIFMCLFDWHQYPHLVKSSFRSFVYIEKGLFVFLLLNLESSLYMSDTSPLSDRWLANISSPFLSFHLLPGTFTKQSLSFWWSPIFLILFSLMDFALSVMSKISLPWPMSQRFSSKSFMNLYVDPGSILN